MAEDKTYMCSQCPELIKQVSISSAILEAHTTTLTSLTEAVNQSNEINRMDHDNFKEAISDLRGWRRWILGVSVGVSVTVSAIVTILGFVITVGAWPISAMPPEASAQTIEDSGQEVKTTELPATEEQTKKIEPSED